MTNSKHQAKVERLLKDSVDHDQRAHKQTLARAKLRSTSESKLHAKTASQVRPVRTSTGSLDHLEDVKKKFGLTMQQARRHMSPSRRVWSRLIHTSYVETTLELIGRTVARPWPMIAAGVVAMVGQLFTFTFALRNGFALSNSEFFILLIAGWCLGLIIEAVVGLFKSFYVR